MFPDNELTDQLSAMGFIYFPHLGWAGSCIRIISPGSIQEGDKIVRHLKTRIWDHKKL